MNRLASLECQRGGSFGRDHSSQPSRARARCLCTEDAKYGVDRAAASSGARGNLVASAFQVADRSNLPSSTGRGAIAVARSHLAPTSQMMRKVDFESLVKSGAGVHQEEVGGVEAKEDAEHHQKTTLFVTERGELVECTSRGCRPVRGQFGSSGGHDQAALDRLSGAELDLIKMRFEEEVESRPGDANLIRNFASFMWEGCGDAVTAKALYERAVRLAPASCPILSAYASFLWTTESA